MKSKKVQFVGSGIAGCPLIKGNSHDLSIGSVYDIDKTKEEAPEGRLTGGLGRPREDNYENCIRQQL